MVIVDMEMPLTCSKCDLYESGGYNQYLEPYDGSCFLAKRCMNGHRVTKGRPSWCPIKCLPDKMEVRGTYPQPGPVPSYRIGWNDCIKKILEQEN